MNALQWMKGEGRAIGGYMAANFSRDLEDYFQLGNFLDPNFAKPKYDSILVGGLCEGNGRVVKKGCSSKDSKIFVFNSFQSIYKIAKKLGRCVDDNFNGERFEIFGRSMGGIVLRIALVRGYISPEKISKINTMGTPHQGTIVPLFFPYSLLIPSCREMLPTSKLIRELKNQKLPNEIEYTNIYSATWDEFCVPKKNLIWDNDLVNNLPIPAAGHADILSKGLGLKSGELLG